MRAHLAGFSLIEALLAALVICLAALAFSFFAVQSTRTTSDGQLSAYAADALARTTGLINAGNPDYLKARTFSATDLNALATPDGRRTTIQPALTGTITPLGGDPPQYRITVHTADITLTTTATGPGGAP